MCRGHRWLLSVLHRSGLSVRIGVCGRVAGVGPSAATGNSVSRRAALPTFHLRGLSSVVSLAHSLQPRPPNWHGAVTHCEHTPWRSLAASATISAVRIELSGDFCSSPCSFAENATDDDVLPSEPQSLDTVSVSRGIRRLPPHGRSLFRSCPQLVFA